MRKQAIAAFGITLSVTWGDTLAQSYPAKPVRLLVGPAAGGATDTATRIVANRLSEIWGQQVVVENRPGAGNTMAPTVGAKATPDGYTLVLCPISDAIAPALRRGLPYDLRRDFAAISLFGTTANILTVNPSLPVRSVQEFVALAKAHPGKLNYGSTGVGLSTHLSMELFKSRTGIDVVHVPYKGAGVPTTDLISGRISALFGNLPGAVDNVRNGKVRALGVSTLTRSPRLPDIPTIAESGVPGFDVAAW